MAMKMVVLFLVLLPTLCLGMGAISYSLTQRTLAAVFLGPQGSCTLPSMAQKIRCLREPDLQNVLSSARQLALDMCRVRLLNKTWNCDAANTTSFQLMTKETAFLHAMYSAALGFTVARHCGHSHLKCSCGLLSGNSDNKFLSVLNLCPPNIPYGLQLARSLLQLNQNSSRQLYPVETHNALFGLKVLQKSSLERCTCEVEICHFDLCYQELPPFIVIFDLLRHFYRTAQLVTQSNNPHNTFPRKDRLWYTSFSSVHCTPSGKTCQDKSRCVDDCCSQSFHTQSTVNRNTHCYCRKAPASNQTLCAVCRKIEDSYICN